MRDLMSHLVKRQVLPVGRVPLVEKHCTRRWTKPRKPVNFSVIYRQQNPLWLAVYVYPHYNDYQVMLSEHWTKFTERGAFRSSVANSGGVLVFGSSFPNYTVVPYKTHFVVYVMHPCKRCRLCGIFWDELYLYR
jgi:hypothetical protein